MREADATNEDNSFQTFSKDGDEWQMEHGILDAPRLETTLHSPGFRALFSFQGSGQLDLPFLLEFRHPEKASSHQGDDDDSEEREGSLPDVFCPGPTVSTKAVEGANHAGAYADAYDCAECHTIPDLEYSQLY